MKPMRIRRVKRDEMDDDSGDDNDAGDDNDDSHPAMVDGMYPISSGFLAC